MSWDSFGWYPAAWECPKCGAVVTDKRTHEQWHKDQEQGGK